MKLSLRLRLLLLLAGTLSVAFSLVHFAISTYTDVALERVERRAARRVLSALMTHGAIQAPGPLGDGVAVQICWDGESRLDSSDGLDASVAPEPASSASLRAGLVNLCSSASAGAGTSTTRLAHAGTHYFAACAKAGALVCAVALLPLADNAPALGRLSVFYLALVAATLLIAVYFALTYWVISPLGQVAQAAQEVAADGHTLKLPNFSAPELKALAANILAMTQRLAAEQRALRENVNELTAAREQLLGAQTQLVRSERMASVGQLAAGLAHEFGNPLTAIQGLIDLLVEGQMPREDELDFLKRIRRETDRIAGILRDLLQFARPSIGQAQSPERGSVTTAINDTLALLTPQPTFRNIDVTTDVALDLSDVQLSQEHLHQVLLNLLLNAAGACKDSKSPCLIHIQARRLGASVELTVRDTGPGVPADLADRIFEPFVTSKDVGEGSGLGLSVCRGLIEAVGGSIQLNTAYTRGAEFLITLPSDA